MTRRAPSDEHPSATSRATSGRAITWTDRLLAESLRWYETTHGPLATDPMPTARRDDVTADDESLLIARARRASKADELDRALRHVRALLGWVVLAGLIVALLVGAATARAALGAAGEARVNFFWMLGSLLGVQTLALLTWMVLLAVSYVHQRRHRRRRDGEPLAAFSIGSAIVALARWITSRAKHDPARAAAVQAVMHTSTRGRIGRWSLSAISHAIWLAFNIGAIVMVVLLLSARQYTFVWETTILSENEYRQLTRWIGALPEKAGFFVPSDDQIAASEWTGQPVSEAASGPEAWSGLLVGSMVLYGFAPRIILAGLSLSLRRRARAAFRLDPDDPYYAAIGARWSAPARRLPAGAPDFDEGPHAPAPSDRGAPPPPRPAGPPAIVGLEIPRPRSGWPPALHGVVWQDLGLIETRDDQARVLQQLRHDSTEPAALIMVADLTTTPDRGLRSLGAELRQSARSEAALILSGGQRLRQRGGNADTIAARVDDWRRLGRHIGLGADRIVELDLEHLTDDGRRRLAALIAGDGQAMPDTGGRRIESAFEYIVEATRSWQQSGTAPTAEQQAKLHRRIAELYGASATSLARRLALPKLPANLDQMRDAVTTGARGMLDLMPDRLRRTGRWATAGALAGGIGCVAAAMTLSPVAIGSLPLWSAVGGVISGLLAEVRAHRASAPGDAASDEPFDRADAVRSAALFAMVLELQGRGEAAIARVLDRTLPEKDSVGSESLLRSAEEVRPWLDDLRHRFDLALAQEVPA